MIKYIVKRLAMGVVTMFFLITITFWLTRLMPGSPFATDNILSLIHISRSGRQRPALFRWREKTRDGKDGLNAKGRLPRSARQVKKAWEAKAGQKKSPRLMRARANGFQDCSSGVITGVKQSARFR